MHQLYMPTHHAASRFQNAVNFPVVASPFPEKGDQGVLLEGPLSTREQDCLDFGDYADVLVRRLSDSAAWPVGVGIYAQWGAGKVLYALRTEQEPIPRIPL